VDAPQGLVLGIVQGLTEFLPVSSSAHLILVPWLLGWPEHSLTYDVALHMGTLGALILFFWRDWLGLLRAWLPGGGPQAATARRLLIGIILGTIPAAIAGLLFQDAIESALRSPALIAVVMLIASALIFAADRLGRLTVPIEGVGYVQALLIGVAQAFALAPGVSRSGATISAGLALGLTREAAARYAFLLATPITAGAGLLQLRHLIKDGVPADERAAFALGIAASFIVGFASIGFLLRYLRRASLLVFVVYRVALALLVLALTFLRPT
jgi:undecaprenyl-diphosphatase